MRREEKNEKKKTGSAKETENFSHSTGAPVFPLMLTYCITSTSQAKKNSPSTLGTYVGSSSGVVLNRRQATDMGGKIWIFARFPTFASTSSVPLFFPISSLPVSTDGSLTSYLPNLARHGIMNGLTGDRMKRKKSLSISLAHMLYLLLLKRRRSEGFPPEEIPHHPQHWPILKALVQSLAGGWWGGR